MTEEINNISQIIRSTEEYSDVCDMCRDEILLYPTISGRTEYSQDEVEQITLKRIIDKLRAKEQECENYKKQFKADTKEMERLEQENIRSLSYSECLEERVEKLEQEKIEIKEYLGISDKTIIQCLEELQKFKNKLKQALDEIEKTINEDDFNLCPIDDSCDCHRGLEKDILDIINKAKEQ